MGRTIFSVHRVCRETARSLDVAAAFDRTKSVGPSSRDKEEFSELELSHVGKCDLWSPLQVTVTESSKTEHAGALVVPTPTAERLVPSATGFLVHRITANRIREGNKHILASPLVLDQ